MAKVRTRNWLFVFYPDSAPDNWREIIDNWHVTCYVSPLHDADVTIDGKLKKPHYHGIICFEGVKAYSQVMELLSELGCNTCQVCHSFQNSLRYLCHLDSSEKVKYNISDISLFGRCDLAALYERSFAEQNIDVAELLELCKQNHIYEFHTLVDVVVYDYFDTYWPVLRENYQFFRAYFQSLHYASLNPTF